MRYFLLILFMAALVVGQFAFALEPSPVGLWQTVDDETGAPRSIIQIVQLENGNLYGRIIQVNYFEGEKFTDVCNLCSPKDPRYNQPNLGMIILTALKPTSNPRVFDDGKVLDPHNGKVYDAKIILAVGGNTLTLRGYVGIALLGRSQKWQRVSESQFKERVGTPIKTLSRGVVETDHEKFLAPRYASMNAIQEAFDQTHPSHE